VTPKSQVERTKVPAGERAAAIRAFAARLRVLAADAIPR
jgi:hypothetical protein